MDQREANEGGKGDKAHNSDFQLPALTKEDRWSYVGAYTVIVMQVHIEYLSLIHI